MDTVLLFVMGSRVVLFHSVYFLVTVSGIEIMKLPTQAFECRYLIIIMTLVVMFWLSGKCSASSLSLSDQLDVVSL